MISIVLASMLLAQGGTASQARHAYGECLRQIMKTNLDTKTDPAAFDTAVAAGCAAEGAAYRNAVLAAEIAAGSNRADAEDLANSEIQDLKANISDLYRANLEALTPQ
jgi:hypothetical protein